MYTLQQIIEEMKVELSIAKKFIADQNNFSNWFYHMGGIADAIDKYIPKLESLLNEQPEAITEGSHFANTDVGGSTANKESTSLVNDQSDTSSETQAVGGNKQTKEVCSHPKDFIIDLFRKPFCSRCMQFV